MTFGLECGELWMRTAFNIRSHPMSVSLDTPPGGVEFGPSTVGKLEETLGLTKELFLVILSDAEKRGLDGDTCIAILRDCGSLPAGGIGLINLRQVPVGLNANEAEKFVRENGALICGSSQGPSGPGMNGDAGRALRPA